MMSSRWDHGWSGETLSLNFWISVKMYAFC